MKFLQKTFIFFSCLSFGLTQLHGKSIDFLLENTTEKTIPFYSASTLKNLEEQSSQPLDPDHFLYCPQITIENIGDEPIFDCFPYVNSKSFYSLYSIQRTLAESEIPLVKLFKLWKSSVVISNTPHIETNPLDVLNFQGYCFKHEYNDQFLKLCQSLGFEIRLANIHGKTIYDFSYRPGYWNLLDLDTHQFYLGLDNKTLISSEELMDDPLLILRNHPKITDAWKELSRFDILNPISAPILTFDADPIENRLDGFDLYPNDSLTFKIDSDEMNLNGFQRVVQHKLDCKNRALESMILHYDSPVPIYKIENCTTSPIVIDQHVRLEPSETYFIEDSQTFSFKILFESNPEGSLNFNGTFAWKHYPILKNGQNRFNIGTKKNPSTIKVHYEINEDFQEDKPQSSSLKIHEELHFNYETPIFAVDANGGQPENICWQISQHSDFSVVLNHFNRTQLFSENIALNSIDETFLNPNETYYFRIKGQYNSKWGDWSSTCEFTVNKPLNIEIIDFEKIDEKTYELNWDRFEQANENSIEYLIFGSNSIDFLPSVYHDKQINAFSSDEISEEEKNDNLIAITKETRFLIKKHEAFSYYRVIVRENGQLSIPSPIIHFYDHDLSLPRNVLQCTESNSDHFVAKRTLFPYQGSATEVSILHAIPPAAEVNLKTMIQSYIKSGKVFADAQLITKPCPPHIVQEAWDAVQPWLMPDNHPCKAKLDRLAMQKRFILNPKVMKQCGFPRAERVGRWSRVCASTHRDMQDYYFKIYHDCEIYIKYDWKRWVHRCEGAQLIRDCIRKNNLQTQFKVPKKWIYAWPENGQQAPVSSHYVAKNFLLVCDNMHICEHKENEKLYKNKIDKSRLKGLYIILQECGLYDSVYCFNMPFNKDGYICIIDTEYWHKWPVPFDRLTKSFSKEMKPYWQRLTKSKKIPDGVNSPNNLPRQDRRDH